MNHHYHNPATLKFGKLTRMVEFHLPESCLLEDIRYRPSYWQKAFANPKAKTHTLFVIGNQVITVTRKELRTMIEAVLDDFGTGPKAS